MGDRITGTERRLGLAGPAGGPGPSVVVVVVLFLPASTARARPARHLPRAPAGGPWAPRVSQAGAVDRALPVPVGGSGVEWISGQWRRASDRILIFRLGRAGAGRGGVGRDASADRIPPVPRADGTARRPRGVAWRDGRGVGTETRLRRGVGEADADHGENPYRE